MLRNGVNETISNIRASLKRDNEDLTPDEELEFFQNRAKALGMDVNNSDDEYGKIIKQGLMDYNPERVVKNCVHLFVFPSRAQGIPARMVGLPTAAMKWIYCLKKSHGIGGWALNDIYTSPIPEHGFKASYCDNCDSKVPRSGDWKWTSKWQNEQMKLHKDIISKVDSM